MSTPPQARPCRHEVPPAHARHPWQSPREEAGSLAPTEAAGLSEGGVSAKLWLMATRRKKQRVDERRLGSLRVNRNDLRKIAIVVAKVGDLKITCDDRLHAEAPEDFRWLPQAMRSVVLSAECACCTRSVEVHLCADHSFVRLTEPDDELYAFRTRIEAVCLPRCRELRTSLGVSPDTPFRNFAISAFLGWCIWAFIGALYKLDHGAQLTHPMGRLAVIQWVAALIVATGILVWTWRPWVLIDNVRHVERPGFWARNSDQLVVGIMMAVLGAVLNRFR
jgi:hypothetical protein